MTNSQIPFTRLRNILHDLGFEETTISGPYRFFQHSASGTVLVYHAYQPAEAVSWHDLVTTRRQLDERGLLKADDFEVLLHKPPVGAAPQRT
jgi:hypothetical protein